MGNTLAPIAGAPLGLQAECKRSLLARGLPPFAAILAAAPVLAVAQAKSAKNDLSAHSAKK